MVDGVYANFTVGIYIKKKTHYLPLITGVAAAVNIVGNLLVIPVWGMYGAAWTTVLSMVVMTVLLYVMIHRHYPVPYEWNRISKIVAVTAILTGIFYMFPSMPLWAPVLLLLVFPVLLYFARFFDAGESHRLHSAWAKLTGMVAR